MKTLPRLAGAFALALFCSPALAQTGTSVQFPSGWAPSQSVCVKQVDGTCVPVSAANPMPVSGGGGGGGGGDASAANQTTQITAAQAIRDRISATAGSGPKIADNALAVTPQTLTTVRSTSYSSSLLVKSGAGRWYGMTANATAGGWILPFDATSCPADGAVAPLIPTLAYVTDNVGRAMGVSFAEQPVSFTTGLVLCFSSTGPFTKTSASTAIFSAQVQ